MEEEEEDVVAEGAVCEGCFEEVTSSVFDSDEGELMTRQVGREV